MAARIVITLPGGCPHRGRSPESQVRTGGKGGVEGVTPRGGCVQRVQEEEGTSSRTSKREQGRGGGGRIYPNRWGYVPPGGRHRPDSLCPRQGAPVAVGGLWRLNSSQRQVAPGQGSPRQRCMVELLGWCQLDEQPARWYATPPGAAGRRFMTILTA